MKKPRKKLKIGRRILLGLIIATIFMFTKKISLDAKITIEAGENVSKIFAELSSTEQFRMKVYLFTHKDFSFNKLESGSYTFNGKYTKSEFVENILKGSEKNYLRLTILEGRSIYDIDEALTRKGYIQAGEYLAFVSDPTIIAKYQNRYEFLSGTVLGRNTLQTLEGFLYPDTYQVDKTKNIIDQLVYTQLENFNKKVWKKVNNATDFYKTMILASIVEKEERNNDNKATVAGIFLKRLDIGMKIDADITLCYGLKTSYTSCTPAVIGKNIKDTNNKYNTRAVRGLPPTTICNPTRESINAVLNPQNSDYLYYLHDMDGNIHYGNSLEEHNANKKKYL